MNAKAFLDTNILVYALAQNDSRTLAAEELLLASGVVSVHVLNEFAAVARRKLGMPWDEVTDALAAIVTLCPEPVPITMSTHTIAVAIAMRHQYRIYDALVAAAALEAGCSTLFTEDMQSGQTIRHPAGAGRVTIRNPFAP